MGGSPPASVYVFSYVSLLRAERMSLAKVLLQISLRITNRNLLYIGRGWGWTECCRELERHLPGEDRLKLRCVFLKDRFGPTSRSLCRRPERKKLLSSTHSKAGSEPFTLKSFSDP
jgi:hypothetical protein